MSSLDSKIIVIGNGFDLNGGLKTNYSSFISSQFFQQKVKSNRLINHLNTKSSVDKWVDIEKELLAYGKIDIGRRFESEYYHLKSILIDYLNSIDIRRIDRKCNAFNTLYNELETGNCIVYNFNYTNTVVNLIKEFYPTKSIEHHFVHGSLDQKEIIFGIEDYVDIPIENIFLKKSFSKIFTTENIQSNMLNTNGKIVILGHSLGESDHAYFFEFFKELSKTDNIRNTEIEIYHYGDEGYKEIQQQLNSLTNKNLTALRLTNRVKFIDLS